MLVWFCSLIIVNIIHIQTSTLQCFPDIETQVTTYIYMHTITDTFICNIV